MSFFAELKRRNVIRVGVAYLVATWLLLQVVNVVAPMLALPDWAPKLILLILAIGFVPVLIFSWAFELTPEGLKRESEVNRAASITQVTAKKLDYITIGLLLAAIGVVAVDRMGSEPFSLDSSKSTDEAGEGKRAPTPSSPTPKSIAVLPFVNMSDDPGNEYFSDGISEEILNALARVEDLKVAGRTSSFAFKRQNQDLRTVGDALGVSHILEGSVRKAGNRVRITAQLVKADDGFHVWSDTYDRELNDVFAIQDEISAAILQQLKAHLAGGETVAAARTDAEVYDLYLLATQRIYERNQASLELAVDLLQKAVGFDPAYAPAHAQIGIATLLLAEINYGTIPVDEADRQARSFLDEALKLQPESADAMAGMGLYYVNRRDHAAAIPWLERALKVNPNQVNASLWLSTSLSDQGEMRRGLEILEANFSRDPLHPPTYSNLGTALSVAGRADEARVALEGLRRYLPGDVSLIGAIGKVEIFVGNWAESHRLLSEAVAAEPQNFVDREWLSSVLFMTRQFGTLEEVGAPSWKALAVSRQGRIEEALQLADQAYQKGANVDFYLQVLAEHGRFNDLVTRVESLWPSFDAFEKQYPNRDGFGALGMILIAQAYGRVDREKEFFDALQRARRSLGWQVEQGADNVILASNQAALAALSGDRDGSISFLQRAADSGMLPRLQLTGQYSIFVDLQGDPRYAELLDRIEQHLNSERAKLGLDAIRT